MFACRQIPVCITVRNDECVRRLISPIHLCTCTTIAVEAAKRWKISCWSWWLSRQLSPRMHDRFGSPTDTSFQSTANSALGPGSILSEKRPFGDTRRCRVRLHTYYYIMTVVRIESHSIESAERRPWRTYGGRRKTNCAIRRPVSEYISCCKNSWCKSRRIYAFFVRT